MIKFPLKITNLSSIAIRSQTACYSTQSLQSHSLSLPLRPKYGLFINNSFQPSSTGSTFTVEDPATGSTLCEVAAAGPVDVDRAIQCAHTSFQDGRWKDLDVRHRASILLKAADILKRHVLDIAVNCHPYFSSLYITV